MNRGPAPPLPNQGLDSPTSRIGGNRIQGAFVMEDRKMRKLLSELLGSQKQKGLRHLQTDERSVATGFRQKPVARPHISLKARMLGGQAETVTRLRGLFR